jgi:hypothetical protein
MASHNFPRGGGKGHSLQNKILIVLEKTQSNKINDSDTSTGGKHANRMEDLQGLPCQTLICGAISIWYQYEGDKTRARRKKETGQYL